MQTGHDGGLRLSQGSISVSGVGTIYNAERSETVKAALMAGADRETANTSTTANITDYRSAGHQTSNGLDDRFGTEQVNIFNSYHILAAGEQSSFQAGGRDISLFGFDYVGAFGGAGGSPRLSSYFFNAAGDQTLSASLVWNISISNDASLTATLHHLNLSLFDVTKNQLLATSASSLDNTQNIFLRVLSGDRYKLRVTTDESGNFSQDYALAWRLGLPHRCRSLPPPGCSGVDSPQWLGLRTAASPVKLGSKLRKPKEKSCQHQVLYRALMIHAGGDNYADQPSPLGGGMLGVRGHAGDLIRSAWSRACSC